MAPSRHLSAVALLLLASCIPASAGSNGPTAHFLTRDVNLNMSCSVCDIAFALFHKKLQKARNSVMNPDTDEVDEAKVSRVVEDVMTKSCARIRKMYALRWTPRGNSPLEYVFHKKHEVSLHMQGADTQREWSDQFLHHRCDWLKDKYLLETSIKYRHREVPQPDCPIKECKASDAEAQAKASSEQAEEGSGESEEE